MPESFCLGEAQGRLFFGCADAKKIIVIIDDEFDIVDQERPILDSWQLKALVEVLRVASDVGAVVVIDFPEKASDPICCEGWLKSLFKLVNELVKESMSVPSREQEVYVLVDLYRKDNTKVGEGIIESLNYLYSTSPQIRLGVLTRAQEETKEKDSDLRVKVFYKHSPGFCGSPHWAVPVEILEWIGIGAAGALGQLSYDGWNALLNATSLKLQCKGHHAPPSEGFFIDRQQWLDWLQSQILDVGCVRDILELSGGPLAGLPRDRELLATDFRDFEKESLVPRMRDLLIGVRKGDQNPQERPCVEYARYIERVLGNRHRIEVALNVSERTRPHEDVWYMPFNMYLLALLLNVLCEGLAGRVDKGRARLECTLFLLGDKARVEIVEAGLTLSSPEFECWPASVRKRGGGGHMRIAFDRIQGLGSMQVCVEHRGKRKVVGTRDFGDIGETGVSELGDLFRIEFEIPCVIFMDQGAICERG